MLDKLRNRNQNATPDDLPALIREVVHHPSIVACLIEDLAKSQLTTPKLLKTNSSNLLQALMNQDVDLRHQFLMSAFKFKPENDWYEQIALVNIIGKLVSATPVENKNYVLEILSAIRTFSSNSYAHWSFLTKLLVKELENYTAEHALDPEIGKMLRNWQYTGNYFSPTKEYQEFLRRIEALVSQFTEKDILGTLLPSLGLRDLTNTRE